MGTSSRVERKEGTLRSRRGYKLATLTLIPQHTPAKAALVFHHGFGEHSGRHLQVLEDICSAGYLIFTYDCVGHGLSGPYEPRYRGYINSYRDLVHDILDFTEKTCIPESQARGVEKIFLSGFSLGGMAVLLAALQKQHLFSGLLLSAPLLDVAPNNTWKNWVQVALLMLLDLILPAYPLVPRRPVSVGIRDQKDREQVLRDPLWNGEPFKVRTVVSFIRATYKFHANSHKLTLPIYAQQGTEDKSCSVIAMRRFIESLRTRGHSDVQYFEIEGAYHDLSHDPETPVCVEKMIRWLEARS